MRLPPLRPQPADPKRTSLAEGYGSASQPLTLAEELGAVAAGVWMLVGLFLDGLAHIELRPDTFFTPWHAVLYTGFGAAVTSGVVPVLRRRTTVQSWRSAIPPGHAWSLIGIATFGAAAILDLVWHETIGFEVSNEALLSPSHLVLMVGGVLALSGPIRTGWQRLDQSGSFRSWLPLTGSLALVSGIAVFFTSYASAFGRDSAASYPSTDTHTHELAEFNEVAFEQLRELWGLAGILVSTVVVVVPLLLLVRRATPPFGAITFLYVALGAILPALGEFRQGLTVITTAAAGFVADLTMQRTRYVVAAAGVAAFGIWCGYFASLAARGKLEWSPALWAGSIVLATLVAVTLGYVSSPAIAPNRRST